MSDQNKMLFAVLGCVIFYFCMDLLFPSVYQNVQPVSTVINGTQAIQSNDIVSSDNSSRESSIAPIQVGQKNKDDVLKTSQRIQIETPSLKGSINLKGSVIDDIELTSYKENTNPNSKNVTLLAPTQTPAPYFADVTYTSSTDLLSCPNLQTQWKIEGNTTVLTPKTPVTIVARMENNIVYKRTISIDENYLFTIEDKITNLGSNTVNLQPNAAITRVGTPVTGGFYVLHEGAIGVSNNKLIELSYEDINKKGLIQEQSSGGGWHGFTDKYWLTAVIPSKDQPVVAAYTHSIGDIYQSKITSANLVVEKGKTVLVKHHIYTGAKILRVLDAYEASHNFDRFHLAVDFGWFYFLTKPLFYVLEFLNSFLGNMGLAILLLTVLFKILVLPLANKSHRSMSGMKLLQPKMEKIKAQFGHDKKRLNEEMMKLYQTEKINPMSGCLPMLIQAPIFFCLYKVFFVTIEMRHAPFFGWIHDLAAPDPTTIFNLFGLIPWDPPAFLMLGAWPLLMGITMVVQQKLGPQTADPQQAKVMMIMPIMFTFMFASFPSGLVIYWAWSNILTIAQQWYMNKYAKPIQVTNTKKRK